MMTQARHNLLAGAIAGAVGGLAGTLAMTAVQLLSDLLTGAAPSKPVHELSTRGGRHDIARLKARARRTGMRQKDATIQIADRMMIATSGRRLRSDEQHPAGLAVIAAGAAYGATVEQYPRLTALSGTYFGAAVWLFAEELALPAAHLSESPDHYPLRDHFNALATHLLYGYTTELVRAFVRDSMVVSDSPLKRLAA
jgi:hypothetical protein